MPDFDVSQYLGIFLDEAKEQLQELDEGILQLEQEGGDAELLNRIFRAAHTLKGSSASMGFDKMAGLTHAMENVFDKLRREEMEVNRPLIDLLLSCLDALREILNEISGEGEVAADVSGLTEKLHEVVENAGALSTAARKETTKQQQKNEKHKEPPAGKAAAAAAADDLELTDVEENVARKAISEGYNVFHLKVTLADDCMMKVPRAYIVFNNLKDYGEVIKTIPIIEDIEAEKFEQSFDIVLLTLEDEDLIANTVKSISEIESVSLKSINFVGESTTAAAAGNRETSGKEQNAEARVIKSKTTADNIKTVSQTVRVDVQRLENLMNLVGELVIDKTRLADVGSSLKTKFGAEGLVDTMEEVSTHIGRITTDLQEEIMKARMFPIEQVFNRFPRMVRDLAKKAGKEVNFIVEGRETELDRTVIEEIGDPLIHLLRNAVDHGLEIPEERAALGKNREGKLLLKALQQENQIVILVRDDGRGINPDVIRQKAVDKGLISIETAARLSRRDALNLIFLPGFSTAEKVSDVSGRGVGMDIVRNHLEKINGLVEIDTQLEKGTTFTVRLPLTLAINRSLLVKSADRIFAFPLSNVVEIVQTEKSSVKTVRQREVAVVRGEVLPLFSLQKALGFYGETDKRESFPVVVAGVSEKRIGFVVDSLLGEQEIVIKGLGDYIGQVPGIAGATILGDGGIALILDVRGLVEQLGAEKSHAQAG